MDSSFLLYREQMQSLAIGKIIAYEDAHFPKPPKYDFLYGDRGADFAYSLCMWVSNEIIVRITSSQEKSVCEIIQDFIFELQELSQSATVPRNKMDFSLAAAHAKSILNIFNKGETL